MKKIYCRLSTLLGERRINRAELSRRTGIRPGTLSDLYYDMAERVDLEQIALICDALDCDLDDILVMEDQPQKEVHKK